MVVVRRAEAVDVPVLRRWRQEATDRLTAQGQDQWSYGITLDTFTERVRQSVADGETWIVEQDARPVGTVAADRHGDQRIWTAAELDDAVFGHRAMVDLSLDYRTLARLARLLLAVVDRVGGEWGLPWLRSDVWTSNTRLQGWYWRRGFEHVRTVPNLPSGVAIQRPTRRLCNAVTSGDEQSNPDVVTVSTPVLGF